MLAWDCGPRSRGVNKHWTSGARGPVRRHSLGRLKRMLFFSSTVAFGVLLATGGLLVAGSLILFMVVLKEDGPKLGGEQDPAPLGWPISNGPSAPPDARSQDK